MVMISVRELFITPLHEAACLNKVVFVEKICPRAEPVPIISNPSVGVHTHGCGCGSFHPGQHCQTKRTVALVGMLELCNTHCSFYSPQRWRVNDAPSSTAVAKCTVHLSVGPIFTACTRGARQIIITNTRITVSL